MSRLNHTDDDDRWPHSDDPAIHAALTQKGFHILLTLAGAAAGLYVMLTGNGVLYLGPFVGICGVYELWWGITRAGLSNGATHTELVRKQ